MQARLRTRGHFLPKRSERTPKVNAPTDLKRRVRVIEVVILCVFPAVTAPKNVTESRLTASETVKKSFQDKIEVAALSIKLRV